jgi:anti-anti-sigma regulatory factor
MLRITYVAAEDSVSTLKLEGKLLGPWVEEFGRTFNEYISSNVGLQIDLQSVTFVDGAGVQLLRDLTRRGIRISACSALVAELLRLEGR